MLNPEQVTNLMLAHTLGPQAHQLTQTKYRCDIAQAMNLAPGSRILEIGCGQGDMTAVLANLVGPTGKVIAVDPADPTYGTPFTLAQSTDHLKASTLGPRIEFHLNQDPLDPSFLAAHAPFDAIVLAHCIWYFPNRETIKKTLANILPHTSKLFIAEWLLEAQNPAQHLHFLAATLQGKIAQVSKHSEANIRTPLTRTELINFIERSGWNITTQTQLNTKLLPDADWEISAAVDILKESREADLIDTENPGSIFSPLWNENHNESAQPLPAILISASPKK